LDKNVWQQARVRLILGFLKILLPLNLALFGQKVRRVLKQMITTIVIGNE
jgi:hypothetical protein